MDSPTDSLLILILMTRLLKLMDMNNSHKKHFWNWWSVCQVFSFCFFLSFLFILVKITLAFFHIYLDNTSKRCGTIDYNSKRFIFCLSWVATNYYYQKLGLCRFFHYLYLSLLLKKMVGKALCAYWSLL